MKYDYLEAMKNDLREVIADNEYYLAGMDRDYVEDWLNDNCFADDRVTGNASGSYTFNSQTAKEYVIDNLEMLFDAFDEFGETVERIGQLFKGQEWETMDCIIRCYLLSEAVSAVCDEMEEDGCFEAQEEEEEDNAAEAAEGC